MMIENNGVIINENDSGSPNSHSDGINDDKTDEKHIENKKPNKRKQTFERKNIRNIIDEEKFGKDAKEAQKAEFERLKRVQEKEQNIRLQSLLSDDYHKISKNPNFPPENFSKFIQNNFVKLAPSRLPPASALMPGQGYKKYNNNINKQYRVISDDCVIYLDDSDDEQEQKITEKTEIIEISDGEEEDDEKEEIIDQEKLDILNVQRDNYGRILINKSHLIDEEDYFLSPKINANIKPHQVSGIRFLYDNLVESKKQFKEADGFGCILAHSMGLGKTIQIIGFLDILFRCVNARSALVIVPINTIQNWQSEIDHWLPLNGESSDIKREEGTTASLRSFNLYVIRDTNKTIDSRHAVIKQWMEQGGVLLIGYEMFRLLVTYRQNKIVKPKRKEKETPVIQVKKKICIDIELEEKRDGIYQDFLKALVNPGPEVVICDEGHRIKNSEASISKALKAVRTHRRVVMTGYPLQNNLTEYWCMVDFVRPNYLGSKHEFNNMFQRPIENGQCVDSTFEDRKLMQGRAHVLHELLEGFVQRRSHAVLKANLPPKWEYVLMVKMSSIQRKLYSSFMEQLLNGNLYNWAQNNTLRTYAMCCKIWNHPDILFRVLKEQKASRPDPDFDFDIDDELPNNSKSTSKSKPKSKIKENKKTFSTSQTISSPATLESNEEDNSRLESDSNYPDISNKSSKENGFSNSSLSANKIPATYMSYSSFLESVLHKENDNVDPYAWVNEDTWLLINSEHYKAECKENSGKIVIFLSLLEESIHYGDKMLVFSQSLLTLDLIEVFLKHTAVSDNFIWEKNRTYFRLDGSTSATERERMIKSFNEPGSEAYLFLLSTRAGCLGINLIGANRVVVFDASWNPCHDCQAVCRVYRYGQQKPCFIYRLVTDNTIEKKIYDRQVTKQGISDRVVDESNPGQQFTRSQVQVLVQYEDIDIPSLSIEDIHDIKRGCGEEDPILGRILENHSEWVTKVPFTHESLLIDRKDYRLTRREKRKAKERYELDKRQSLYYQKNSYSDYYIKTTVPVSEASMHNRLPLTAYRSSILPTLSSNPTTIMNNTSARFQLNKNLIRPQLMTRPNSALLREIEQARLRCGFTKNTPGPFPIAVSDDEEDQITVRKKPKLNSEMESLPKQMNVESQVVIDAAKPQPNPIKTKADSSSETKSDKNFKVVKINATTELNFPATPSIVNSQAGQPCRTKISVGEPLEIIYTAKGKFLRVTRTGDLFAIKDSNKEKLNKPENVNFKDTRPEKSAEIHTNLSNKNNDDVQNPVMNNNSIMNLFDIRENENKQQTESVNSEHNSTFFNAPHPSFMIPKNPNEDTSISSNCSSSSNVIYPAVSYAEETSSSPMIPGLFSNSKSQAFQTQICCNCKASENPNNFIRGCGCICHKAPLSNHQQGIVYNVPSPSVFVSQFPNNSQMFYNQAPMIQPQFMMNGLSGAYTTPQFYDERTFNLMNINPSNSQNSEHHWPMNNDRYPMEFLDHGGLPAEQISKSNNPIYSSYDFSDL